MVKLSRTALMSLLARFLLAGVFLAAGLPKIQDPLAFATAIEGFHLTSGSLTLWIAIILPWLELVIALGLLTPWLKRASATLVAGLLALFIALHASAWLRGLDIHCGCFGESADSPDYHWLILRNLALLIVSFFLICTNKRNKIDSSLST